MARRASQRAQGVDLAFSFPRSQSDWTSLRHAGTNQIQGGSTSQPTGLKGSAANTLTPETTGHPQRSCVLSLMGQELSLIQNGASMDWTYSQTAPDCSIRFGSGAFRSQVNTLSYLWPTLAHSWAVFFSSFLGAPGHIVLRMLLPCVWVGYVCQVGSISIQFTSRTFDNNKRINVIPFTRQCF